MICYFYVKLKLKEIRMALYCRIGIKYVMFLCIIENCFRLIQLEVKKNDNKKEKIKRRLKRKKI